MRVVVGVCVHNQKFLMGRRSEPGSTFSGYWEFPGGKVEERESDEVALTREMKEELNADLTKLRFVDGFEWNYPNKTVDLQFYLIDLEPMEISKMALNAHSELQWLSYDEALAGPTFPANIEFLKRNKSELLAKSS